MLTLNDGRNGLYQWDTGRTLQVSVGVSQVHFSNRPYGRSIDVQVENGIARIPDILLQTDKNIFAWAYVYDQNGGYTKAEKIFPVEKRNKPSDYFYTPEDVRTVEQIASAVAEEIVDEKLEGFSVPVKSVNNKIGDVEITLSDLGGMPEEGNPDVDVEFASVSAGELMKAPELVISYPENDEFNIRLFQNERQKGEDPAIELGDWGGNPVRLGNLLDPIIGSDAVNLRKLLEQSKYLQEYADDKSIKVSGAEVGQFLKVAAVDEKGVPTAWETVELQTGGKWEKIIDIVLESEVTMVLRTVDDNGDPFELSEAMLFTALYRTSVDGTEIGLSVMADVEDLTITNPANGFSVSLGTLATSVDKKYPMVRAVRFQELEEGLVLAEQCVRGNDGLNASQTTSATFGFVNRGLADGTSVCSIKKIVGVGVSNVAGPMGIGSRIVLYGVRK